MDEIDQVVKNYYTVIGQKDEDIFELYKDNKRLRKQLDEVLTVEEEWETERRTLKLLVVTLQTELQEKQVLIEGHQAEGVALRNALSRVRDVLHMSSELNYTADDVIDVCIGFYTECHELREQRERLTNMVLGVWSLAYYTLAGAEEWGRRTIADVCEGFYDMMGRISRLTTQALLQREHIDAEYKKVERERLREAELKVKQTQVECRQHKLLLNDWQEKVTGAENRLLFLEEQLKWGQMEKELLLEAACSRLDLMTEQCADARRISFWTFRSVIRHEKQLQEALRAAEGLKEKTEELESAVSRVKNNLRKQKQRQRLSTRDSCQDSSDNPQSKDLFYADDRGKGDSEAGGVGPHRCGKHDDAFRALQVEHNMLKAEWRKCAERERTVRQRASTSISRLKMERSALETSAAVCQGRCSALEEEVQRLRLEVKQQTREVKRLQERRQSLEDEVKRLADRTRSLEDVNSALEVVNAELLDRMDFQQGSHAARLNELQKEAKRVEEVHAAEDHLARTKIAQLEKKLHDEKEEFLRELKEWTLVLEEARAKLAAAESERDRERMLRDMLQEQHREEEKLLKNILVDERERVSEAMQRKIDALECACRRSAEVIAGLREAAHRGKTKHLSAETVVTIAGEATTMSKP